MTARGAVTELLAGGLQAARERHERCGENLLGDDISSLTFWDRVPQQP